MKGRRPISRDSVIAILVFIGIMIFLLIDTHWR